MLVTRTIPIVPYSLLPTKVFFVWLLIAILNAELPLSDHYVILVVLKSLKVYLFGDFVLHHAFVILQERVTGRSIVKLCLPLSKHELLAETQGFNEYGHLFILLSLAKCLEGVQH